MGRTPKFHSSYLLKDNSLYVSDRAYGEFKISDPRVLRVFNSKIFQKTLKITQHGVPGLIGWSEPVSRGEHMIGAYPFGAKTNRESGGAFGGSDSRHNSKDILSPYRPGIQG